MAELTAKLDGKTLIISIGGEMFAWIVVEPTLLHFSNVKDDDPVSQVREFRLTSTDDTPFRILGLRPEPNRKSGEAELDFDISSAPSSLAHRVTVRLVPEPDPARRASFSGKIVVTTDHARKPELTVSYSGFYASQFRRN